MFGKKIVIFGAGKIGRSFIGQIFSCSGYEVVFIDVNRDLIGELNRHGCYRVIIKSNGGDEVIVVRNIKAIHLSERKKIIQELSSASIAAISVGRQAIATTLPLVAISLVERMRLYGSRPLDFILAENMRNANDYISEQLTLLLPSDYPSADLIGLVETSIGKMVPIMSKKDLEDDPLQIFAEPYNYLIVAKDGFRNPVPDIPFLAPKSNIKAWVDRKLFIHNLGHATAAYTGYLIHPDAVYMYEVLDDPRVYKTTFTTMLQSADILMALYPGEFTRSQLETHITDLLGRFKNRALGDTLFRVGCDLYRKLGPDDRLIAPIRAAMQLNLPYNLIMDVVKAAVSFRAKDENGEYLSSDKQFFSESGKGLNHILKKVCNL